MKKLAGLLLVVAATILQPYTLVCLNEWHFMAIGSPSISFMQAYVIGLVVSLYNYSFMYKNEQNDFMLVCVAGLSKYGLILLIGFILTLV